MIGSFVSRWMYLRFFFIRTSTSSVICSGSGLHLLRHLLLTVVRIIFINMINPIQNTVRYNPKSEQNKTKHVKQNKNMLFCPTSVTKYTSNKKKHVILPDERTPPNEDNYTNLHPTQSQNHQRLSRLSRLKTELEHPGPGPPGNEM